MPRSGGGIYSKGSPSAVSGTTIQSAAYNTTIDDLVTDANAARPISAGGTGAANAADARTNLGISATNTPFTPAGNIAASNVQAALAELDTEKALLAGSASQTFSVAAASANDHAVSRSFADARYDRITTSPTALTGGATIPSTENGRSYSLALPTHQTCALPLTSGLPDGFSCVLRVTGAPAAFQQAFVNGNGKLISYRGSSLSVFYLYGFDETFRFTWFSSLNVWVAECLLQPSSGVAASFTSNVAAWNGSPTAWTPLLAFGNNGSFATNYAFVPNFFSVAVSGIYTIFGYAQFSAGAGGATSGVGYLAGGTNAGHDTSRGFTQHSFNTTDGDGATLQVTWTEVLQPNELRAPYFLASTAPLYTYLAGNYSIIRLLER